MYLSVSERGISFDAEGIARHLSVVFVMKLSTFSKLALAIL